MLVTHCIQVNETKGHNDQVTALDDENRRPMEVEAILAKVVRRPYPRWRRSMCPQKMLEGTQRAASLQSTLPSGGASQVPGGLGAAAVAAAAARAFGG